jgi:hypothetical protein
MMHGRETDWIGSVETPEGNRPLGKPRCRWEDNIKIDLKETGSASIDWIHLAQDRH